MEKVQFLQFKVRIGERNLMVDLEGATGPILDKGKKCDDTSSCNSLVVADDGDCLTVSKGINTSSHDEWILDSGYTMHVCSKKEFSDTFQERDGGSLFLGDGTPCKIQGVGNVKIKMFDGAVRTLGGVVYIPKLRRNLISLSQMDSNGCKYFAGGGAMKITRGGKILMKGEKCEGLHRLIGKTVYSTKVWKRCAQGSGYPRCESFEAKTKLCFQVANGCEGVKFSLYQAWWSAVVHLEFSPRWRLLGLVLIPIDFFTSNALSESILFGISVASALTPQMLPLIVNTSIAKGALAMARDRCTVKSVTAIRDMGSMDILCIDKTGTLTMNSAMMISAIQVDEDRPDSVLILRVDGLSVILETELKAKDKSSPVLNRIVITKGALVELNLVFLGLISFFDPPKDSAKQALWRLAEKTTHVVTGTDPELLNHDSFHEAVKRLTVLARLTPTQKLRVVQSLQTTGQHVVGFLGDEVNDSLTLEAANVRISVESGASIAKDFADIMLLEKDLNVLVAGVERGRLTFANTMKYIKMSVVANVGSILSIYIATLVLWVKPLTTRELLTQNFLYNVDQIAIPWDNTEEDYVKTPQKWSLKGLAILYTLPFCLVCPRPSDANPNYSSDLDGEDSLHSRGGLVACDLLHSRDLCHRNFNSINANRVRDGVQTLAAIILWVFGCAFYWVFHNRPDSKESFYSGVQDMALDVKINIYERMLTQKIVQKQKQMKVYSMYC
ncbi:hypothetical protein Acr_07g0010190 [Actinidia rufa]|uniref:Retrovirus-related Pol polyprotein from transposon TNT 1-94-like beta-barrel domain-containing protein n=1 Tax=Actinidia rufa TaxID=165716 RepID=A0A7J0EWR2_9ERIC|nr:hypothetical protein Acr_07g0010190 [Actinidia rufa]